VGVLRHRVLKIAPTSFFADYGCHVRIYEETRVLQRLGQRVVICSYHTGRDLNGVDVRRAPNPNPIELLRSGRQDGRIRYVDVGSNFRKPYYDALLALKTAQVALRVRPTVIHAHLHEGALIGYPLSRLLGVPLVFDFQGSLTSEMLDHRFLRRESFFFGPLYRLEGLINRGAQRIITSSHNAWEVLVREFGYPPERVCTLPDSVDTEVFRPRWELGGAMAVRARLGIPEDCCVVVYLGLLASYQGTGLLLEAASQLVAAGQPVHFLIMGFPGEEAYRAQASAMGLDGHTTFTGRVPYQDAPLYLAAGDIAISPKLSETEGNGKLLNYMAAGLPTVTFDTPVAREILGDLGIYANPGDAADLASCIGALVKDAKLRESRGWELRTRAVRCFSWDAVGRELVRIYDELTDS